MINAILPLRSKKHMHINSLQNKVIYADYRTLGKCPYFGIFLFMSCLNAVMFKK